jgi:hypothetical protein
LPAPHAQSLAYPYQAGRDLPLRAQDLDACETGRYDVVWAIHSLYYVAAAAVPDVVRNLRRLLAPETGVGLIYIASRDSFCLQIHEKPTARFLPPPSNRFLSAEHYADAFAALVVPHQQKRLRYFHEIPVEDHALLESYLHKCVLDPAQLPFRLVAACAVARTDRGLSGRRGLPLPAGSRPVPIRRLGERTASRCF